MQNTRHLALGVAATLAVAAAASALFIWPNYREARAVRLQVAELQGRVSALGSRTKAVERLAEDLHAARMRVQHDLKVIPETADIAGLIRKLSDTIDAVNVVEQTFTAGTPGEAIIGGDSPAMMMPVTADMRATFESVLALIRKAETMGRLVRVSSVRLLCKREEQKTDVPLLHASVGLEVVYEPADTVEEGH